jgi:hypothetical protein
MHWNSSWWPLVAVPTAEKNQNKTERPPVRHVHGEENPNAVDLQPKVQKSQNSHFTPVWQPPTEAVMTVNQAGEGSGRGSTPNYCRSAPKKKNPKQKNQKEERTLKDVERKGTGGGKREGGPSSLLARLTQKRGPRVFFVERERVTTEFIHICCLIHLLFYRYFSMNLTI